MKVDPTKTAGVSGLRRPGRTGKTGSAEFSKLLDETDAAEQTARPSGVQSVDSMLAAQEVGDRGARARRARERADLLLDRLEDIRHGLLLGAIPRDRLQELAATVRRQREDLDDPRITELLDEIELRARVELAKFERSV